MGLFNAHNPYRLDDIDEREDIVEKRIAAQDHDVKELLKQREEQRREAQQRADAGHRTVRRVGRSSIGAGPGA